MNSFTIWLGLFGLVLIVLLFILCLCLLSQGCHLLAFIIMDIISGQEENTKYGIGLCGC